MIVFQAPRPSVSLYDRFYKLHKCLESLSRELDLPESVVTSKRWELCWFDWNWDSSHAYSDVRVIEPVTNIKRNRNRSASEDIIIISIGITSFSFPKILILRLFVLLSKYYYNLHFEILCQVLILASYPKLVYCLHKVAFTKF